jgi:dTDP-4-dehydrorhamnose reductase
MRIVVTGREGQVVRSLLERGALQGHTIIPLGRPDLDLAGNQKGIVATITAARPAAIVSAAAYTAVDKAEAEPELAFAINHRGAEAVAIAAAALKVPLAHLSTDYVFDGTKGGPYCEADVTDPATVYGASKLAGEQAVLAATPNAAVLRTAWVYSPFGASFLKTMLRLASSREEVAVVADQYGNPSSALDIADAVLAVLENLIAGNDPGQRGIFHLAGTGNASWAEFAETIFERSRGLGGPFARVTHIGSTDYPTAARRPANSSLDCGKLERAHKVRLPHWQQSTADVVARIVGLPA